METRDFHHVICSRPVDAQTREMVADSRDARGWMYVGMTYTISVLFCHECLCVVSPRDLKEFQ